MPSMPEFLPAPERERGIVIDGAGVPHSPEFLTDLEERLARLVSLGLREPEPSDPADAMLIAPNLPDVPILLTRQSTESQGEQN